MPLRFRAPYIPRLYPTRPVATRAPAAGRGRGAVGPGGIDASSTGNIGGDIVKAIGNQIQMNRMNAVANQILNTQNPPRAAWVGGTAPAAGVPTTGSAPQTGGFGELQMRQQVQQQDLADQLQRAKLASEIALARQRSIASRGNVVSGGSGSRWRQSLGPGQPGQPTQPGQPSARPGKAGKPAGYVPGSGDVENDSSTDNFSQIRADFDAQHGKGSFDTFTRNMGNVQDDGKGNLVLQDQNGKTLFSIPKTDAPYWTQRYNAARVASGQGYLGDLPAGQNPNSGQPGGSQVNPFAPKSNLEVRSLPYGSYMIDPQSGQLTIKQRPSQGSQAPAQANQAPAQQQAAPATEQASDEAAAEEEAAKEDQPEQPDEASASANQATAQPDQVAQTDQDEEEARRRQAMLSLAMNQPGAGTLYPAQDLNA